MVTCTFANPDEHILKQNQKITVMHTKRHGAQKEHTLIVIIIIIQVVI